ncbi:AgrD family cyclic lactone autoinducer peptide [Tatumella citrea]
MLLPFWVITVVIPLFFAQSSAQSASPCFTYQPVFLR